MALRDTDIILSFVEEYDICIDFESSCDVVAFDDYSSHDVVVDGLTIRKSVYGDELYPIIMYLQTSSSVVPYVTLLTNPISEIDDEQLTALDLYSLTELDRYTKGIALAHLKTVCDINRISQFVYVQPNEMRILCELTGVDLQVYLQSLLHSYGLECVARIIGITFVTLQDGISAALNNYMNNIVPLTIFLDSVERPLRLYDPDLLTDMDDEILSDMDYLDHTVSLKSSEIPLHVKTLLNNITISAALTQIVDELHQRSRVDLGETNVFSLSNGVIRVDKSDRLSFVRFRIYIDSSDTDIYMLEAVVPSAYVNRLQTGFGYDEFLTRYDNSLLPDKDTQRLDTLDGGDKYVHLKMQLGVTGDIPMSFVSPDLALYPSIEYYDNYLLTSLDPDLITDLEGEIN